MSGYRPEVDWSQSSAELGDDDPPVSRWWALPALLVGALVTFAVHQFASSVRAEAAGICSTVFFVILLSLWKYHRERWFLPFVAIAILAHAFAIWLIPWPSHHDFEKSDLVFGWLDYLLFFVAALIIDRFVRREK